MIGKTDEDSYFLRIANLLTLYRLIIGLPVVIALSNNNLSIAFLLVLSGCISDCLDGYFARKSSSRSIWGARMDPLADKILLCGPLLWLSTNSLPIWGVWLLIARELFISAWRSAHTDGGPASTSGKMKTMFQFACILLLLLPPSWFGLELSIMSQKIGYLLFWPSLILAYISGFKYIKSQLN